MANPTAEPIPCAACRAGVPIENGKHRYGLPGGYPNWQPCRATPVDGRPIADYLIRQQ